MPITHMRLPEQSTFLLPTANIVPEEFMPQVISSGVEFLQYDPGTMVEVSPSHWQGPGYHKYVLEMGETPDQGAVHILTGKNGLTWLNSSRAVRESADGLHTRRIPEDTMIVMMGHVLLKKEHTEFGGSIMYMPNQDELAQLNPAPWFRQIHEAWSAQRP